MTPGGQETSVTPFSESMTAFGMEVRQLRKARKMTLKDLARASGVSLSHLSAIERGTIEHRRTITGTLEAKAEFVVAPKVSGRVERLDVDLADTIRRGQQVAKLDDDEYLQSVAQAEADFAVAKANLVEAQSLTGLV